MFRLSLVSLPGEFSRRKSQGRKNPVKAYKKWTEKYEKLPWKLQICLVIKTEDGDTGRQCVEVLPAAAPPRLLQGRRASARVRQTFSAGKGDRGVLDWFFVFHFCFFLRKKNSYVFGSLQYQSIGISLTKKFHEYPSLATAARPSVKKVKRKSHTMETHSGRPAESEEYQKDFGLSKGTAEFSGARL